MKTMLVTVAMLAGFAALGGEVRYVATDGNDSDSGSGEAPFATVARAVESLGDAGGIVYVADGTYALDATIEVLTPVKIVGESADPTKVVFDGGKARRVCKLSHDDAGLRYVTLKDGYLSDADAANGANLYLTKGTVEDCILRDGNTKKWDNAGGNAYVGGGRLSRCRLYGGKAGGGSHDINEWAQNGSSVYADGGVVENCLITGVSTGRGAACAGGTSRFVNCTITGNSGDNCAGMYIKGDQSKVVNCVIFGNTYTGKASADYAVFRASVDHYVATTDASAAFQNCASEAAVNGTCLQVADAGFVDAANGDYAPTDASPLVNAGLDYSATDAISALDFAGRARVYGCRVDIGCFENQTAVGINFSSLSFVAEVGRAAFGMTLAENSWDADVTVQVLRDGQIYERVAFGKLTAGASRTIEYSEPGVYSAKVVAKSEAYDATVWTDWCYLASATPVRFVSPAGTDDQDGSSVSLAMRTIGAAVSSLGADGGRVYVLPGTYREGGQAYPTLTTNALYITTPVEIVGVSGAPKAVQVTRVTGYSRVLCLNNKAAAVRSLTLTGGSLPGSYNDSLDQHGGNLRIRANGGTVENCVIVDGSATAWASAGGNVYMEGGRLVRCELVGGVVLSGDYEGSSIWRYNGSSLYAKEGVIENCLIHGCKSGSSPVGLCSDSGHSVKMVNCTIVDNIGLLCGGVMVGGGTVKVVNTAIFGNEVSSETAAPTDVAFRSMTRNGYVTATPEKAFDHCAAAVEINANCLVADEPKFVGAGDWRLQIDSPLVDAGGDYAASGAVAQADLTGDDRLSGRAVDIGAYENGDVPYIRFAELSLKSVGDKVTFRVAVDRCPDEASIVVSVIHDGVTTLADELMPRDPFDCKVYEFTAQGTYSAKVTVRTNDGEVVRELGWVYLTGSDEKVRFVSPSGNDANDGLSLATPVAKIDTALDSLDANGGRVYLLPGTYRGYKGTNAFELATAVKVIGVSGRPADVLVYKGNPDNKWETLARTFKLNHPDAAVRAVTIRDGYFQADEKAENPRFPTDTNNKSGGNVWITSKGGSVENCNIVNGNSQYWGGAGGNVYIQAGRLANCSLTGGTSNTDSDNEWVENGGSIWASGGVVENCLIRNCTSGGCPVAIAGSAKLINCTIVSNSSAICGGIIVKGSSARAYNCAIFDNVCKTADKPALYAVCRGSNKNGAKTTDETAAAALVNCAAETAVNATCVTTTEPLFVDAESGDYRLLKSSPLRNRGVAASTTGATALFDLVGFGRVDRSGRVDIGACEWHRLPKVTGMVMIFR